jgi:hypothetical protein
MKKARHFLTNKLLIAGLFATSLLAARAEGRPGSVEWSDGHKLVGAISLTPGKDLRLFTTTGQVSIQLAEVKELKFTPEKEETREGFYFPNAGQATQAKTGELYPTRSIQTEITLADGKVLDGHLFTTALYVETDANTEKVVLVAKQTGADGQKLADLIYPTMVSFDDAAKTVGSIQIDLSQAGYPAMHSPVVVSKPDLTLLPTQQVDGKSAWTVPTDKGVLFSVEASDGIHVLWPMDSSMKQNGLHAGLPTPLYPPAEDDPVIHQAVETSLKELQDFYDTRALLGCFAEEDDVYSLVMMKRLGPTDSFKSDKIPWSLVILHWKYDPDAKKTTLLNRVSLAMGRAEGSNSPLPAVLKEPELARDITALPAAEGNHP